MPEFLHPSGLNLWKLLIHKLCIAKYSLLSYILSQKVKKSSHLLIKNLHARSPGNKKQPLAYSEGFAYRLANPYIFCNISLTNPVSILVIKKTHSL